MADIIVSGSAVSYTTDHDNLLNFQPLSKDRRYNAGLDENNKYPEDYYENYSDLLNAK